jgi:hypothetical protein
MASAAVFPIWPTSAPRVARAFAVVGIQTNEVPANSLAVVLVQLFEIRVSRFFIRLIVTTFMSAGPADRSAARVSPNGLARMSPV